MKQTTKLIIGIIAFAAVLAGAIFAYNSLSKQVDMKSIQLAESKGTVSGKNENNDKEKAPDFTVTDENGNSVKLSEILSNGKPVVLNFWASWCPPCKKEMPDFDAVYKELGDEIQFMMVDLTDGSRETVEAGKSYIEQQGFSFPVFFDENQEGAIAYGIQSIPTTLFINSDGHLITGAQGAIDEATLRTGIEQIRK